MQRNGTRPSADGVSVLVCAAVWLVFSVAFFEFGPYSELARLSGAPLLETRFEGYDADALSARLGLLGAPGRGLYEQFQILDGANAILMAVALTLLINFSANSVAGEHSRLKLLAVLPAAAGGLEVAENVALIEAIRSFPAPGLLADAAGRITQIKLVFGFGSLLFALLSLVALAVAAAGRRARRH